MSQKIVFRKMTANLAMVMYPFEVLQDMDLAQKMSVTMKFCSSLVDSKILPVSVCQVTIK